MEGFNAPKIEKSWEEKMKQAMAIVTKMFEEGMEENEVLRHIRGNPSFVELQERN